GTHNRMLSRSSFIGYILMTNDDVCTQRFEPSSHNRATRVIKPNYNKIKILNIRMLVNLSFLPSVLSSIQRERQDRRQPSVGGVIFHINKHGLSIADNSRT